MSNTVSKIDNILKNKGLSRYKLSKLINCTEGALNQMVRGNIAFSEKIILSILPVLEVSREEFESWILADKYSKELIQLAIEAKKTKRKDKKLIITAKIDEILESKGLSRTAFSKQINHSQSSFNNAITGKESLSKNLMTKISTAFEIPIEIIQSWVLADKYPLKTLEKALAIYSV